MSEKTKEDMPLVKKTKESKPEVKKTKPVVPKVKKPKEDKPKVELLIGFDAEWEGKTPICVTFYVYEDSQSIYIHNPQSGLDSEGIRENVEKLGGVFLETIPNEEPIDTLIKYLSVRHDGLNSIRFVMFYSPTDIVNLMGETNAAKLFMASATSQKKRIYIKNFWYKKVKIAFEDTCGWQKASLETSCKSVGVDPGPKNTLTKFDKEHMTSVFRDRPELAIGYSLNDAKITLQYWIRFQTRIIEIARTELGVRLLKVKPTIGGLVANIFESWLANTVSKTVPFNKAARLLKIPSIEDLKNYPDWLTDYKDNRIKKWRSTPFSSARITTLGKLPGNGCFSSLVIGARCVNEDPTRMIFDNLADIDLSSCYGSALEKFDFPVGICTTYSAVGNTEDINLGDFLKKYREELVPGLFQITCYTRPKVELSFDVDFLCSKIVTKAQIQSAVYNDFKSTDKEPDPDVDEESLKHIPGQTLWPRRELYATVLTFSELEVIDKIASNQEKSELYSKLIVMGAAYYPRSKQCKTVKEWCIKVGNNPGKVETVNGSPTDNRSRLWFKVPLSEYIGPLLRARKRIKALMVSDPDHKDEHNANQNCIKLLINTLYGDLASCYFEISNAVLANNITGKARCGAWKMAKALGLVQTITDGGLYVPGNVPLSPYVRDGKKASLHRLANLNLDLKECGIKRGSLGGVDWNTRFKEYSTMSPKEVGVELDNIAGSHLKSFWEPYGTDVGFDIEHKGDNTSFKGVTMCKAHYGLQTVFGKSLFKIRGKESDKDNPVKLIMGEILAGNEKPNVRLDYTMSKAYRINSFKKAVTSGLIKRKLITDADELPIILEEKTLTTKRKLRVGVQNWKTIDPSLYDKLPGEYVPYYSHQKFNNTHFPVNTVDEGMSRYKRKPRDRGVPTAWFEKYLPKGIQVFLNKQAENKL